MRQHYDLILRMRTFFTRRAAPTIVIVAGLAALAVACVIVPPQGSPSESGAYAPAPQAGADAADADTIDPPARVGRISLIEGIVSFRPAQADSWAVATINRPVTTGDRIWADSASRAELEVDANAVRIGSRTELDVTHLDDDLVQLAVPEGTIELRLRRFKVGGEYEIDAPNAAVNPQHEGSYRVDVSPDGDTSRITVWSGIAEVTSAGSTFEVDQGQLATVVGDSAPTYNVTDAGAPDAFDQWVTQLDQQESRGTTASRYLPPDISGLDQLDAYGTWANAPVCGPVWYPNGIAADWAPYRDGSWAWIDPWGWNWVADEPWGWAPFHYGRWENIGGAWGWCPGEYPYGAIYSPMLVTFIGGPEWAPGPWFPPGEGWGWFPLGWGDSFVPPYPTGPFYRHWINGRMPGPRTPYRNRGVPGAITAVPATAFRRAEEVSRVAVQLPAAAAARAPIYGFAPGVAPTAASLSLGLGEGRFGPRPPGDLRERPVMALRPPPPRPVPFAAERPLLDALHGRPLPPADVARLRTEIAPAQRFVRRPFVPAATPFRPGVTLHSARPGLAPRPALSSRVAGPTGVARSPLDQSYEAERQAMMQRHIQEFAQPQQRESEEAISQRQEAERRELETRYNAARSSGMSRMPSPQEFHGGGGHGGGGGARGGGRR